MNRRKPLLRPCPRCYKETELLEVEVYGLLCSRCVSDLARAWPEVPDPPPEASKLSPRVAEWAAQFEGEPYKW